LFLKGQRCYGQHCPQTKKAYPPGQGGEQRLQRRRVSDYGKQLREKQKMRYTYGILEKQFRSYVEQAERAQGVTGEVLMQLLERRLDNVIYRSGLASSRAESRQLVTHGHFQLNDKRMNVPSALVRAGDVIKVKDSSKEAGPFKELKAAAGRPIPEWMTVDYQNRTVTINAIPSREQIDTQVDEQQVVEFYSR